MGFLSRKPKVGIEEFCREFYDSQIFHPIIAGTDVGAAWRETVLKSVTEADNSFAAISPVLFQREYTALRVELFGLALTHHLKRDEHTLPETIFTKIYLEQNGQLEIWDAMLEYNQAIARSAAEIATGKRARRATMGFINELRFGLGKKWIKAGVDVECAARVLNRIGTEVSWSKGITLQMLVDVLLRRLGCQLNSEGIFRLQAVLYGLYNGAKEAVKSANLQGRPIGIA